MGYVCYFNDDEYVTNYDLAKGDITVSNKSWKAIIFYHEGSASYIAEKFGCYYKNVEED